MVAGVREGGAILRGEVAPARRTIVGNLDVKKLRERYDLSQGRFAALLCISVKILCNWEQGRRTPEGPTLFLLQVVAYSCFCQSKTPLRTCHLGSGIR
ncbi:MAG: helix-turn-helix domain-containing protein [Anaerolineae bacterium]|nr:helix-turn-helix domain-containing protein [Anaerolineae bacterium]